MVVCSKYTVVTTFIEGFVSFEMINLHSDKNNLFVVSSVFTENTMILTVATMMVTQRQVKNGEGKKCPRK